jgi:hypothetical protein
MDEQQQAERVRALFEASAEAPEGVELWRWLWAPATTRRWCLPVQHDPATAAWDFAPPPDAKGLFRVVEVEPVLWLRPHDPARPPVAAVGWNREVRTAVLFMGRGGTLPPRPPAAPGLIGELASQGRRIRDAAAMRRLVDLIHRLRDELGLSEGEKWKRDPS